MSRILPIVKLPTPSLRVPSVEVNLADLTSDDMQTFMDAMIPTMYDDDGIGLAAPQVANNIRIFAIGKAAIPTEHPTLEAEDMILVNPTWQRTGKKSAWDIEGCLSVPDVFGYVRRYTRITVNAYDRHGNPLYFEAHDFLARVVQHEVDHLNGVLFIDKARDIFTAPPEGHPSQL